MRLRQAGPGPNTSSSPVTRLIQIALHSSRRGPWAGSVVSKEKERALTLVQYQAQIQGPISSEHPWDHQEYGRIKHGQLLGDPWGTAGPDWQAFSAIVE